MDWYLSEGSVSALPQLRREFTAYLSRHGDPASDVDAAELIFAEAVGNAVRHTEGPVWITVTWSEVHPQLHVYDLGAGFDPAGIEVDVSAGLADFDDRDLDAVLDGLEESGRGLFILHELAPALEAHARSGSGMVVSTTLPVTKPSQVDHDPPRRRSNVLPDLSEALPTGGFGRESFLRSLVVQMAQTMEMQQGPDAAAAAVAQVGTDVGGRMEEEFRLAESIVGRMDPEQMSTCYVRLKHAIEGDFHVVEVSEDRIVLVNTRCPFGEAVTMAPSLCRMTSSVFGGIAARNSDEGSSVLLEERIAVGDASCRVVVNLGQRTSEASPQAHYYARPADDTASV